jgi:hypothetical protein
MPRRDRRRVTATFNFQTSMYWVAALRREQPGYRGILRLRRCPRCDREVARP